MILDMAMGLLSSKIDKAAEVLGRNPAEIRGAVSQAKKLLPEIKSVKSASDGARLLKKIGVDKKFLTSMADKYGRFGSKIGISQDTIRGMVGSLGAAMDEDGARIPAKNPAGFNNKKYIRV